ncbi:hypothetical protein U1Q18_027648, partial [Sarracenia purpurea var. burkii]
MANRWWARNVATNPMASSAAAPPSLHLINITDDGNGGLNRFGPRREHEFLGNGKYQASGGRDGVRRRWSWVREDGPRRCWSWFAGDLGKYLNEQGWEEFEGKKVIL